MFWKRVRVSEVGFCIDVFSVRHFKRSFDVTSSRLPDHPPACQPNQPPKRSYVSHGLKVVFAGHHMPTW